VLDPVEASIARRRSYATILSHLCPPLRSVEGSSDLRNMHHLVHDYYNTLESDAEKRADIAAEILDVVGRIGFKVDVPPGAPENAFVGAVHDELVSLEGEFATGSTRSTPVSNTRTSTSTGSSRAATAWTTTRWRASPTPAPTTAPTTTRSSRNCATPRAR
jgi:hypothetical protein